MGTLGAGKRGSKRRFRRERQRTKADGLRPEQGQPVPAKAGAGPIAPQKGESSRGGRRFKRQRRLGSEGPEDGADAAGFAGVCTIALALGAEVTGATVGDAGGIQHAQTAVAFRAPFLTIEGMV